MRIRFGYVAMSTILKDCSPSHTITLNNLMKLSLSADRYKRLAALARMNIANTTRLFHHNRAHDIKVFRLTSKLVPLATHPELDGWDWRQELGADFKALGDLAIRDGLRISAHPDHFTLLNSQRYEVVEAAVKDLIFHEQILDAMGLDASAKLVIHVGGSYKEKPLARERFIENFCLLPDNIKARIVLENDDKSYSASEVLELCQQHKIPMVLDIHHHWCLNQGESIEEILPAVFATWDGESLPPKVHISSPRDGKNIRAHADHIDSRFFMGFLDAAGKLGRDFDVMCEAKAKDAALFQLLQHLAAQGYHFVDRASIDL
ncbi:MAG: UV DNA damage repair endonuclease UvsE [Syntrophomonadaceae bacterium]|nr:UV DNA damage repair endonuclease UvsE [Syntrophomonadaceae bacterium]